MNRTTFLRAWSVMVGSMDAVTGLLLIFAPALVLRMLDITSPSPDGLVFLSWVGVFVLSVGMSYGLALGGRVEGQTVWLITSLVRLLVAIFVVVNVLSHRLQAEWLVVAFSDALVGVVQLVILKVGWWKEVPK